MQSTPNRIPFVLTVVQPTADWWDLMIEHRQKWLSDFVARQREFMMQDGVVWVGSLEGPPLSICLLWQLSEEQSFSAFQQALAREDVTRYMTLLAITAGYIPPTQEEIWAPFMR